MCEPTTLAIASLALTGAGIGASALQAQKSMQLGEKASKRADANSKAALAQQDQEMNRRNAKQPNVAALESTNANAANLGQTLLSGVGGVDPTSLQLGKNTILGR